MAPNQYVQKPYKVLAEQFTGTLPEDTATRSGLCICEATTAYEGFTPLAGQPHVHTLTGHAVAVHATDWIVQELWHPYGWYVIPDAEFTDRFGGTGPPTLEG